MTEDEARGWIASRFGDEATERVGHFLAMVVAENDGQNLIAPSTVAQIWVRHALDSAQLVPLGFGSGTWLDVGTGGGFPGMIVALLRPEPVIMVEPRTRRAEFLANCVRRLGLLNAEIRAAKVEQMEAHASVISARAVAAVEKLLLGARHCANEETRWILPRGRSATRDLDELRRNWTGSFHVEHSLTDPESAILVLDRVRAR